MCARYHRLLLLRLVLSRAGYCCTWPPAPGTSPCARTVRRFRYACWALLVWLDCKIRYPLDCEHPWHHLVRLWSFCAVSGPIAFVLCLDSNSIVQVPVHLHVPASHLSSICCIFIRSQRPVPLRFSCRLDHFCTSTVRQPRNRQGHLHSWWTHGRRRIRYMDSILCRRSSESTLEICDVLVNEIVHQECPQLGRTLVRRRGSWLLLEGSSVIIPNHRDIEQHSHVACIRQAYIAWCLVLHECTQIYDHKIAEGLTSHRLAVIIHRRQP